MLIARYKPYAVEYNKNFRDKDDLQIKDDMLLESIMVNLEMFRKGLIERVGKKLLKGTRFLL
jgi:hypothetical protein